MGSDKSTSQSVVIKMVQFVLNKGYMLYMDNCNSSPKLFIKLPKYNTNTTGIKKKKKNMKNISKLLAALKKRNQKLPVLAQWHQGGEIEKMFTRIKHNIQILI